MNYMYKRAESLLKYLIDNGIDPEDAMQIVLDKYSKSRLNQRRLKANLEHIIYKEYNYERIK